MKLQYQNQGQILVCINSAKQNVGKSPHVWQNILAYKEFPGLVALNEVIIKGDFQESSFAACTLCYIAPVNWQKCRYLVSSLLASIGLYKDFMTSVLSFCSNGSSNQCSTVFWTVLHLFLPLYIFCAVSRCQNNEHGRGWGWKK